MSSDFIWIDGIENALNEIKVNAINNSENIVIEYEKNIQPVAV